MKNLFPERQSNFLSQLAGPRKRRASIDIPQGDPTQDSFISKMAFSGCLRGQAVLQQKTFGVGNAAPPVGGGGGWLPGKSHTSVAGDHG